MKENKTDFIIVRVTKQEKESLKSSALKLKQRFSVFIRLALGLK